MPKYPPERWLDYCPMNLPLKSVPFLPIKVPLPEQKTRHLKLNEQFDFEHLINICKQNHHRISAVIDLTFTKYYDKAILNENNIQYFKILVEGHSIPKSPVYKDSIVDGLLTENPNDLIVIHCTHGVNRTGYLVCRYLVETLNLDPLIAIREFEKARGHRIERVNYRLDLLTR